MVHIMFSANRVYLAFDVVEIFQVIDIKLAGAYNSFLFKLFGNDS